MATQLIAFNQSTAGKTAGLCLQNVRTGFNIPAKYPNAITAWQHTQQHADRNVPTGLDVPLYYTYATDGHINVRLANGTVWSDGNIYASIDDYLSKHTTVHYLGWGESVNDVAVIKLEGDNMPTIATQDIVESLAHAYLNDSLATNPGLQYYVGQPVETVIGAFNNSTERDQFLKSLQAKDVEITDLQQQLAAGINRQSVLDYETNHLT